jgi:hypothetical protein
VDHTVVPDGTMQEGISNEGFGKNVTVLQLMDSKCSVSTVISMITAFPNLRRIRIHNNDATTLSTKAPPAHPVLPRTKPLDFLQVTACAEGLAQALATFHFTSRDLFLDVRSQNTQSLLVPSSEDVASLALLGAYSFREDCKNIDDDVTYRQPGQINLQTLPHRSIAVSRSDLTGHHSLWVCPLTPPHRHSVFHFVSSSIGFCQPWRVGVSP